MQLQSERAALLEKPHGEARDRRHGDERKESGARDDAHGKRHVAAVLRGEDRRLGAGGYGLSAYGSIYANNGDQGLGYTLGSASFTNNRYDAGGGATTDEVIMSKRIWFACDRSPGGFQIERLSNVIETNKAYGAPNMVHGGRCNIFTVAGNAQSITQDDLREYWCAMVKTVNSKATAVSIRFKNYCIDNTIMTLD